MSTSPQPWYKSVLFVGTVLTLLGFGFFTLLYYLLSLWILR
jgi:hypothetical protein